MWSWLSTPFILFTNCEWSCILGNDRRWFLDQKPRISLRNCYWTHSWKARRKLQDFPGVICTKVAEKRRGQNLKLDHRFTFLFFFFLFCAPKFNKNPGWIASMFRLLLGNFADQNTTDGFEIKGTHGKDQGRHLTEAWGQVIVAIRYVAQLFLKKSFSSLWQISSGRGWLWLPKIGKSLVTLSNVCLFGIRPTPVLSSILTIFYLRYIL